MRPPVHLDAQARPVGFFFLRWHDNDHADKGLLDIKKKMKHKATRSPMNSNVLVSKK